VGPLSLAPRNSGLLSRGFETSLVGHSSLMGRGQHTEVSYKTVQSFDRSAPPRGGARWTVGRPPVIAPGGPGTRYPRLLSRANSRYRGIASHGIRTGGNPPECPRWEFTGRRGRYSVSARGRHGALLRHASRWGAVHYSEDDSPRAHGRATGALRGVTTNRTRGDEERAAPVSSEGMRGTVPPACNGGTPPGSSSRNR
jgi:hypothetical protein